MIEYEHQQLIDTIPERDIDIEAADYIVSCIQTEEDLENFLKEYTSKKKKKLVTGFKNKYYNLYIRYDKDKNLIYFYTKGKKDYKYNRYYDDNADLSIDPIYFYIRVKLIEAALKVIKEKLDLKLFSSKKSFEFVLKNLMGYYGHFYFDMDDNIDITHPKYGDFSLKASFKLALEYDKFYVCIHGTYLNSFPIPESLYSENFGFYIPKREFYKAIAK